MRFRFLGAFLASALLAGAVAAQSTVIGCAALSDEKAYPSNLRWMAPLQVVGDENWIFRPSDLDMDITYSDDSLHMFEALVRILRQETGTLLAIVLPPSRGAFGPDADTAVALRDQYSRAIDQLRLTGAIVPDILAKIDATPGAASSYFFRSDSHWTPSGAIVSAQALADALVGSGVLPSLSAPPRYMLTGEAETLEIRGGLLRAVETVCNTSFDAEVAQAPKIVPVPVDNIETALFGDATDTVDVTLVGTSFSRSERFGWQEAVQLALQQDSRNRAVVGGGFDSAVAAYFANELRLDRPKLLVWEFQPYYANPNIDSSLRWIIGNLLGHCTGANDARLAPLTLSGSDWSEEIILPAGHDLIHLSLPEMDLGNLRFRLHPQKGEPFQGRARQRDRIAQGRRSDVWTFYAGQIGTEGTFASGGKLQFRLDGNEDLVDAAFTSCASASRKG